MPRAASVKDCCKRTVAVEPDAAFCGECGSAIVRCMAFEECGALVGPDGLCPACIQPVLDIDPRAVRDAQQGGVMTLPFKLTNASTGGRPLFVTGAWVRTGDEARRPADLLWERIDPGQTAPISVRTSVLEHSGVTRVELVFAAETRFRWRTESFLFAASVSVNVQGDQAGVINQTINLTADTIEPGATVYAPVRSEERARAEDPAVIDLQLVRAERLELELDLRGVDRSWRLPRNVRLRWRDFGPGNAPSDGPIATPDGILAFGRSRTKLAQGPGDVRMLAMRGDGIDEEVSVMISRRHCEVFVQNDRLMVRPDSESGILVDGDLVQRGEAAVLRSGSVVALLAKYPKATAFRVDIRCHHGIADEVTLTREGTGARA